jgi:hypothetical protein
VQSNQSLDHLALALAHFGHIFLWEKGYSLPDLENAFKLAALYNTTVKKLFADLGKQGKEGNK